ncbi:MAG TPA: hypothetical protein VK157_14685 [Phycisphaerales bacterium]|nr:hypothetical protein [Phycisphaerales bacterium]
MPILHTRTACTRARLAIIDASNASLEPKHATSAHNFAKPTNRNPTRARIIANITAMIAKGQGMVAESAERKAEDAKASGRRKTTRPDALCPDPSA